MRDLTWQGKRAVIRVTSTGIFPDASDSAHFWGMNGAFTIILRGGRDAAAAG
jgi:hypothetical protein